MNNLLQGTLKCSNDLPSLVEGILEQKCLVTSCGVLHQYVHLAILYLQQKI